MPFALLFRLPSSVFRSICQPSIPLSLHLNDHISFVRLRNLLTSRLRKSRYLSKSLILAVVQLWILALWLQIVLTPLKEEESRNPVQ